MGRTAFWCGRPFLRAFAATGNKTYLAVANRSAYWYVRALRSDGGVSKKVNDDFRGLTFHSATSGSIVGAILMLEVYIITKDQALLYPILSALQFAMGAQFRSESTHDKRMFGAVFESVMPSSYGFNG